jgi:hypothetical protein
MYPDEVAGMVLIDPTQEELFWDEGRGLPVSGGNQCSADDEERGCQALTFAQAHESPVPTNIPVFLIHVMYNWPRFPFRSKEFDEVAKVQMQRVPARLKFHKEWVNGIPGAQLIVTEKSSHGGINFEEPDLVIRTIRSAVEKARTSHRR